MKKWVIKMKAHEPPFFLKEIKIELTHTCNLSCEHCSSSSSKYNQLSIDNNRCISLLKEAAEMGVSKIAFSGGEPLLYPGILDIVKRASKYDMDIIIYTTGNIDSFKETASELQNSGLKKFIFSLYSTDFTIHESITNKSGSFNATCGALLYAKSIGLDTELHFVPLADNFIELPNVVELGYKSGTLCTSILRFVPQGRGKHISDKVLSKIQNLQLRQMIIYLRRKGYHVHTGSPFNFLQINDQPQCSAAIDRMSVLPDLTIYPCDAFKNIKAEKIATTEYSSLANNSLQDCWAKSSYLNTVREYLTTPFHIQCSKCYHLEKCLSGCLAQKVIKNGDFRKDIDPNCLVLGLAQN